MRHGRPRDGDPAPQALLTNHRRRTLRAYCETSGAGGSGRVGRSLSGRCGRLPTWRGFATSVDVVARLPLFLPAADVDRRVDHTSVDVGFAQAED
jgi:hypothetical protein